MKIAVVGSRSISKVDISIYIDLSATEIVSGGAAGVDSISKKYAKDKNIKYTEFLPEYSKYGRAAPIVRNKQIVDYSDFVLIFWDGRSQGTKFVISYCEKTKKEHRVIINEELSQPL